MIFTQTSKTIRVMITPFRDGLQSSFGGKVRLDDYLPAMKAAAEAGIRHMEFGGGARYQAPYFYLGENPFETMQAMRDALEEAVEGGHPMDSWASRIQWPVFLFALCASRSSPP